MDTGIWRVRKLSSVLYQQIHNSELNSKTFFSKKLQFIDKCFPDKSACCPTQYIHNWQLIDSKSSHCSKLDNSRWLGPSSSIQISFEQRNGFLWTCDLWYHCDHKSLLRCSDICFEKKEISALLGSPEVRVYRDLLALINYLHWENFKTV